MAFYSLITSASFLQGSIMSDAVQLFPGTYRSWVGNFSKAGDTGWVYHHQHGWLLEAPVDGDGSASYLYDPRLGGWLYTSASVYPHIYGYPLGNWLYYFEDITGTFDLPRVFFNYASKDFVRLPLRDQAPISELASGTSILSTLTVLLQSTYLGEMLAVGGPYTVFAPTDEALAALPAETVTYLLSPQGLYDLIQILLYHVVPGEVRSGDLTDGPLVTLSGAAIDVSTANGIAFNGDTGVTAPDIIARNGTVHVINKVLLPPSLNLVGTATEAGSFGTLLTAASAAALVDPLTNAGPFTVFAPSDAAFAKLPPATIAYLLAPENIAELAALIKYHVVSGRVFSNELGPVLGQPIPTLSGGVLTISAEGGPKVNGAAIVATDIQASNGVIHVVDEVILPNATITETAVASPALSTLVTTVVAADLAGALGSDGPFTVFAPVNAAFEALPEGTLTALLGNIPALTDILELHVIAGAAVYSNNVPMGTVATLGGELIAFSVEEGKLLINGSVEVITADIPASNGVIHLINGVITAPATPAP